MPTPCPAQAKRGDMFGFYSGDHAQLYGIRDSKGASDVYQSGHITGKGNGFRVAQGGNYHVSGAFGDNVPHGNQWSTPKVLVTSKAPVKGPLFLFLGGTGGHGWALDGMRVVVANGANDADGAAFNSDCASGSSVPLALANKKCAGTPCNEKECCAAHDPCHGAETLLSGAASAGTCKADTLAAGKSCWQVGKSGHTCTATVCSAAGKVLVPGKCSAACGASLCGHMPSLMLRACRRLGPGRQRPRFVTCLTPTCWCWRAPRSPALA